MLLWVVARRRRSGLGGDPIAAPLSSEERAELQELLGSREVSPGAGTGGKSITKV